MDEVFNEIDEETFEDVIVEDVEDIEAANVKISNDVVATIAKIAANEIDGVAGMCTSITDGIAGILSGKKGSGKGVRVEINENNVIIDLYIIVEYGKKIPEIAWDVQENVKESVESMTGMTVEKVNIHVDGVSFKKNDNKDASSDIKEEQNDIIVEDVGEEELPDDIPEEGSEGL